MSLPDGPNLAWPPANRKPATDELAEADAWYSGDISKLANVHGNVTLARAQKKRWWSRRSTPDTSSARHAVHLPAAADIASTSADLMFGDPPRLLIPEAHDDNAPAGAKEAEARLQEMFEVEQIDTTLVEAADAASGLGGVFLRAGWDPDIADHPLLSVVHPDFAIPEFAGHRLRAVTFWREVLRDGQAVWRHLERHEPGVILHGLFVGNPTMLGTRVGLDRHPDTSGIAADTEGRVVVPVEGLVVRYVPNAPNRKRRGTREGASDTAGAGGLMDALDETWSSWMRDIRLGKSRILVDSALLARSGRGSGASFDEDQEIFSPIDMGPVSMDKGAHPITMAQFEIRTADHAATSSALFEAITRNAGYSPQSFGLQGDGSEQTATEVDARENRSVRTTMRKRRYWQPAVEDIAHVMLILDREIFGSTVEPFRPRLEWPEPGGDDLAERADTLAKIEMARAASTETKVRLLNPEWEREQVLAEVQAIHAEQGLAVPDPTGGVP